MKETDKENLIKFIKESGYRFAIVVLPDMSNLVYNGNIEDVGIMGFAFKMEGKKIKCLQWLNHSSSKYSCIEKEDFSDILLHHTIKEVIGTDADRLSRLVGGDDGYN